MDSKTFGKTIADLRKEKGMTQAELAEKLGVTDKAVSKWERDLSYPDTALLPRIAELFGLSVDDLMRNSSMTKDSRNKSINDLVMLILRAVALAMGVAVAVTSILDAIDSESAAAMLGLGLACLAITLIRDN